MFEGIQGVLEIGSRFDVGAPIAGRVGDVLHGAGVVLYVSLACGYDDQGIRGLLAGQGILSWGAMASGDDLALRVAKVDADRAVEVLSAAGIEVV